MHRDEDIKEKENGEKDLVCMTQWYGPEKIIGNPIAVSEKETTQVRPSVSFLQGGISGLRYEGETSFEHDSSHGDRFQMAFAFVNGGQPFLIKVEIQRGLRKMGPEVKEKAKWALKFGSIRHKEESISTTLKKDREVKYDGPAAVVESDASKLSLGESELGQETSTETPPIYSEREVEGTNVSTQQLMDVIMSLISPAGRLRGSSTETEGSSTTVVDEKRESTTQIEVDSRTVKVMLKILLLQMLQGWHWLIALFIRKDQ
ncbi:uncharacterized protein PAC_00775 [Phialocephala subalpina]|uniref:Uncharacterized protein n=1 Tax=Phialocephala subalpina TaxID=576137 RepID=A0A1L7WDP4_9HELO|nr:uncharacterized protein PAC_00775 [Phialocephala subalpina]